MMANQSTQRKPCPAASFSTTNNMWTGVRSNPGLHGVWLTTNCLRQGVAYVRSVLATYTISLCAATEQKAKVQQAVASHNTQYTIRVQILLPSWPQYTVRLSHQVCHTKPLLRYPRAHTTGAPDTGHRTYSRSHKCATTNHWTFTHRHTYHTRNPQQQVQQPPQSQRHPRGQRRTSTHGHANIRSQHLHITRNLCFLKSQKFLHKRHAPHTGLPEENH
jgi:hypothetical protein